MKKLFTSIRQGKLGEVARILDKNPGLISCLAKAPPKKDDGQSPLMVAIKSDNLEVAHLLLDRGADVNFRDAPTPSHNESAPSGITLWANVFCGQGTRSPRIRSAAKAISCCSAVYWTWEWTPTKSSRMT